MNLAKHYQQLYQKSTQQIRDDQYLLDPLINSANDNRFGLTLLIRPDEDIKTNIQSFLDEIKIIEPSQYYYQNSDIHLTVMSIISCELGFKLESINTADYVKVIKQVLDKHKRFPIHFKGITASSSCILLQGFPETDTLNDIRNQLRFRFKNSSLQQSIDQRYSLQTAHSTVIRFKEKLQNTQHFLTRIEKYSAFDFGTFEVKNLELVYNDWYQKQELVQKLHTFELKH